MNSTELINRVDYYMVNHDYTGTRELSDDKEIVEFKNHSTMRIWYNDLPTDFDSHCHSAIEMIVPVENYYDSVINQELYRVNPGECLIIPPGELHSLSAPSSGIRFIYLFDMSALQQLAGFKELASLFTKPVHLTKENYPLIYHESMQLLADIRNDYFNNITYADLHIYAKLLELYAQLGHNRIEQIKRQEGGSSCKNQGYIKKFQDVVTYIDTHYNEDLNLEKIAYSIGFSKYHFSRLFKQYTNYTFCDYLNYRRVKVSEELLCDTELPITEVALQSGFSSISTFNRLFKQSKGCTPTEYRNLRTIVKFS